MHLHIKFKRLYLQVHKINSVVCCSCVPIQVPGHCTDEVHNTFKSHILGDKRWQSAKGSCISVMLTGSRDRLAWLKWTATALERPHLQGMLLGWVLSTLGIPESETMVPRVLPLSQSEKSAWCPIALLSMKSQLSWVGVAPFTGLWTRHHHPLDFADSSNHRDLNTQDGSGDSKE